MSLTVLLLFWFSCVHSVGDGYFGSKCGSGDDAPCGPLLTCSSEQRCVGDGSVGALCDVAADCRPGGEGDNICNEAHLCQLDVPVPEPEPDPDAGPGANGQKCPAGVVCTNACDWWTEICRNPGNGNSGAKCDSRSERSTLKDAICKGNQACDYDGSYCRPQGDGNINAKCDGSDGELFPWEDIDCKVYGVYPNNEYMLCHNRTHTCRPKGKGGDGEACGSKGDYSCGSGLGCDATWTCRPKGDGNLDSLCGRNIDPACNAGYACDGSTGKCRVKGTGVIGSVCGDGGDAACSDLDRYVYCDQATVPPTCRAVGHGDYGDDCGQVSVPVNAKNRDEQCKADKFLKCSGTPGICVGIGVEGAPCGGVGDTDCSYGFPCVDGVCTDVKGVLGGSCRSTEPACDVTLECGNDSKCVPIPEGTEGAACNTSEGPECDSELVCETGVCGVMKGTLGGTCRSTEQPCDITLKCGDGSKCVPIPEGTEWGACKTSEGPKCDSGLVCGTLLVCLKVPDISGAAYISRISFLLMIMIFGCLL